MRISLLKLTIIYFLCFIPFKINAIELICGHQLNGQQPSQDMIVVNCSSRKDVVNILKEAWLLLRKEGYAGTYENLCWDPYNRAMELPPNFGFENVAPTFFMQCNTALRYIK